MDELLVADLFCGAGGAARGIELACQDAGIAVTIVGVDNRPMPRYPYHFVLGEWNSPDLEGFDFVWASPPCQKHTCLRSVFDSSKYKCHISETRERLLLLPSAFVIENVVGAPLRKDLILCAASFGLRAYRHRIFECSFPIRQPEHPEHLVRVNRRKKNRRKHWDAGGFVTVVGDIGKYVGPEAMGIDWMTGNELSQAIPPAYSRYIFTQWLRHRNALIRRHTSVTRGSSRA